ncbi:MAG: class I SAM-dependent methyltransferase, partial [Rhodospirillales bacterium]
MSVLGSLRSIRRGREEALAPEDLRTRAAAAAGVLLDLGTGDGAYPYRFARDNPDWFAIGLDAAADNLAKTAKRIGAKPAKGGVDNLVLLVEAVERLPDALDGIADRLTVNFPWGSLQQGLVLGEAAILAPLRRALKPGGRFDIWLNMQVFADHDLR